MRTPPQPSLCQLNRSPPPERRWFSKYRVMSSSGISGGSPRSSKAAPASTSAIRVLGGNTWEEKRTTHFPCPVLSPTLSAAPQHPIFTLTPAVSGQCLRPVSYACCPSQAEGPDWWHHWGWGALAALSKRERAALCSGPDPKPSDPQPDKTTNPPSGRILWPPPPPPSSPSLLCSLERPLVASIPHTPPHPSVPGVPY